MPTFAADAPPSDPSRASLPAASEDCRSTANLSADTGDPLGNEPQPVIDHREVIYELAKLIGRQIARDLMAEAESTTRGEEEAR